VDVVTDPDERLADADTDSPPRRSSQGGGYRSWVERAREYRTQLEARRWLGLPLRSLRRFNEIEGKHLALVIAANLFIAIIPLLILGYAFFVAFNPHHSFGVVLVRAFHMSGSAARTVEDTFSNARSGRSTALSISVISLFITGFDISATVQTAYARAFRVTPLSGWRKYVRGAAWLIVLLTITGGGLTLRYLAASHSAWYLLLLFPAYLLLQFGFFIVTPRLLLDLPFAWRDLARGAAVGTVAAVLVGAVSSFELRRWISGYSAAYGGFGTALSIIAYVSVLALFWVWVAAVMGAYWEQQAGSDAVSAMQRRSTTADR
jgi:uncharacterized BrkB/YihY/UPF0761 family membrane protein